MTLPLSRFAPPPFLAAPEGDGASACQGTKLPLRGTLSWVLCQLHRPWMARSAMESNMDMQRLGPMPTPMTSLTGMVLLTLKPPLRGRFSVSGR